MKSKWILGLLPALAMGALSLGLPEEAFANGRAPVEICGNGIDDDGDGATDETTQGGCLSDPTGSPISGDGIVPEQWTDNPSCQDLGFGFGFKIDSCPSGTYTLTPGNGDLTGGAVSDPNNSVTITCDNDNNLVDWSSTLSMDAVFVKGGPEGGNVYVYDPEDDADIGLGTPGAASGISHIEFCYDYELVVEKTAEGSFDRTITWELDKSVSPDAHTGFAGDSFQSTWTVELTKNVVESNFQVTGEILITNPSPVAVDFTVIDLIDGSINAPVSCPGETVPASDSVTCTYTATGDQGINGDETTNEATVTSTTEGVGGGSDTAPISFTVNVIGDESVTVDDDRDTEGQFPDETSSTITYDYMETFTCSTNPGDYTNGVDSDNYPNTATATGESTNLSDSADVDVTCYIPLVSKDATPAWEEFYDWDIFKNVDNTTFVGFVGDSWEFNYDIDVDLTTYDARNFSVSGTITVQNPNPNAPLTVALTDAVNGFDGVITADADCDFDGTNLTIPAGGTATCDYSVDMGDELDEDLGTEFTNTATATFGGGSFSGTEPFKFEDVEPTLAEGSEPSEVTATDDNASPEDLGDDHTSETISSTTSDVITYQQTGTCPADVNEYTNGVFELTLTNIAEINETEDSDTETVTITCYLPAKAKVVKTTTEGDEDIGQFPFTFELYAPGLVPGQDPPTESQTLGTGGGELTFGTDLEEEGTWKVVEVLPDGWVSTTDTSCMFDVAFPGSADQTYTCDFDNVEMSRVDLLKLTNGVETTVQTWSFVLYEGPDGFGGTVVASDSTPPALLDFDDANLDPFATYTLCELGVPAGYSTFWQIDTDGDGIGDATVIPYNPNAGDNPPEDLGNRCVDFGAGTGISLVPGTTLHFVVDNQQPGGAPRTPGYYKNWNRCTGGGQQYTADANGGWMEGFWLVEDVLNPAIGGGIVWDDILADDFVFPITTCAVAVDILDKRLVADPNVVGDGRKVASDPLHNLATHLLAAQLNFGAGACTTQDVLDAALAAETLLDKYNFDGNGHDPLKKNDPDAQLANDLANYLDLYNNGQFCGDGNN